MLPDPLHLPDLHSYSPTLLPCQNHARGARRAALLNFLRCIQDPTLAVAGQTLLHPQRHHLDGSGAGASRNVARPPSLPSPPTHSSSESSACHDDAEVIYDGTGGRISSGTLACVRASVEPPARPAGEGTSPDTAVAPQNGDSVQLCVGLSEAYAADPFHSDWEHW